MPPLLLIWSLAGLLYLIFLLWYVGFQRKLTEKEIDAILSPIERKGELRAEALQSLKAFFHEDDGKDFVMVNLLKLKEPRKESSAKLGAYGKVFLTSLLRRAGHPVFMSRIAGGKIENIGCEDDDWGVVVMVRYRSRRDLLAILPGTVGSEHHALKWDSLERTTSNPGSPWMIAGGPKLVVPLLLVLMALIGHLAVVGWAPL